MNHNMDKLRALNDLIDRSLVATYAAPHPLLALLDTALGGKAAALIATAEPADRGVAWSITAANEKVLAQVTGTVERSESANASCKVRRIADVVGAVGDQVELVGGLGGDWASRSRWTFTFADGDEVELSTGRTSPYVDRDATDGLVKHLLSFIS